MVPQIHSKWNPQDQAWLDVRDHVKEKEGSAAPSFDLRAPDFLAQGTLLQILVQTRTMLTVITLTSELFLVLGSC